MNKTGMFRCHTYQNLLHTCNRYTVNKNFTSCYAYAHMKCIPMLAEESISHYTPYALKFLPAVYSGELKNNEN